MAVDLHLWDGVFTVAALGKENGFEGGFKCLAGGYRTGLLFSECVALHRSLGILIGRHLLCVEPA